jgi:O-antigen/teichoic acid export membrane protein
MEAWQSQDTAPLYGVDQGLLRQALSQEEAKVQTQRRVEGWVIYAFTPLTVGGLALLFLIMVYDDDPRTDWDFALPIVGAAAFLLWACFMVMSRRAQARRERQFGASLRGQAARHLAQLDYQVTRVFRLDNVLRDGIPPFIAGLMIILAGWRVNNEPFSTQWHWILGGVVFMAVISVVTVWLQRRRVRQELLPRKHRLEALLKELDGQ